MLSMAAVRELPWLERHSSPGRVVPFPRLAPFNFLHTRGRFWQPRRFTPRSLCSEGRRPARSGSLSRRASDPRSPGRARAERAAIGPSPGIAFRCRGSMDANLRLWRAEGPVRRRAAAGRAAGRGTGAGGRRERPRGSSERAARH